MRRSALQVEILLLYRELLKWSNTKQEVHNQILKFKAIQILNEGIH